MQFQISLAKLVTQQIPTSRLYVPFAGDRGSLSFLSAGEIVSLFSPFLDAKQPKKNVVFPLESAQIYRQKFYLETRGASQLESGFRRLYLTRTQPFSYDISVAVIFSFPVTFQNKTIKALKWR